MSDLILIYGENITDAHITAAHALDMSIYPEEYHLPLETCLQYYKANNRIYTMLSLDGKIIGYLNFSPIDELTYRKMRSGNYLDLCVEPKNVLPYEDNREYYGYFSSIVMEPNSRNKGYSKILLRSLISQLSQLTKRGIYFKRIVADVISPAGATLMKNMGLQKKKVSKYNSCIYEGVLIPNKLNITEYNSELIQKYNLQH